MSALSLKLPDSLFGRAHVARLIRELEVVENDLESQKARGTASATGNGKSGMPNLSKTMVDCLSINEVDIMNAQMRMKFKTDLGIMKDKAPVMHFTLAVEPDEEFMEQLVSWIRKEINQYALISIGLQPSLVGGAYLRTPNHVHDFTLKSLLNDKRPIITEKLEALHEG